MSQLTFEIFFNKDQKRECHCETDDLLSKPLSDFASSESKKIEDFFFFYKGALIDVSKNENIKDTIFGNSGKDKFKIFALPLTPIQVPKSVPIKIEQELPEKKPNEIELNSITKPTKEIIIETKEEKRDEYEEPSQIRRKINKVYYNDIVCPKCETTAIIEKNGLNLNVLNCENFHYLKNITFDVFDQFVYDYNNDSNEYKKKFRCNICGMPKNKLKEDKMYICSCGCRVCNECRNGLHKPESKDSNENKGHFQVNIEDKNYYCLKHGAKNYTCYCIDCNANLCDECKNGHDEKHDIEYFKDIRVNKDYVKDLETKAKEHKTTLLDFIEITRLIFDKIINTIEDYLNSHIMIEKSLIRRFKNNQFNYQLLRNLKNKKLFENDLFKTMEKLNSELKTLEDVKKNFKDSNFINNQFNSLFNNIYSPINRAKQASEKKSIQKFEPNKKKLLVITYDIPGKQLDRRVKLFDPVFVENNKDNISMKIKINGIDQGKNYYTLTSEYRNNRDVNQFQVELTEKDNGVTDMSYMLNNCKYVKSVNFSNWEMKNITSVEAMFQLCNFNKVPDVHMIDMRNLVNARAMFCKCKNITTLDNWREWKECLWFNNKVEYRIKNMSMLFNGCINLKTVNFPKWTNYINQLEDISYMFNRCKSLIEVNHLSVLLNSPNMKNLCGLFNGCISLNKLSSKFSSKSPLIEDLSIMFQNCTKVQSIEAGFDNARNIRNISGMFAGCKNLRKITPGIFYTDNLINMAALCKGCGELETLYDIGGPGKYNMSKVANTKEMFSGCKKLKYAKWLPYIKFKAGTNFDEILKDIIVDKKDNIKKEWDKNKAETVEKNVIDNQ